MASPRGEEEPDTLGEERDIDGELADWEGRLDEQDDRLARSSEALRAFATQIPDPEDDGPHRIP
eukprot:10366588-Lingulodinium_polyedra.AAC.1